MTQKKTLVLGASVYPHRYSFLAAEKLLKYQHEIILVGKSEGKVFGVNIEKHLPKNETIDTVTLYLAPHNQGVYIDDIIRLQPNRIIFNPGTENPEFMATCKSHGIEVVLGCTLVMLSVGEY